MTLPVHILSGGLGLLSGYAALYATKGTPSHGRSGMLFVSAMLTMAVTALLISVTEGAAPAINAPSALLTVYLIVTSLRTVRPAPASRSLDTALMVMALAIGAGCTMLGVHALAQGAAAAGLAFPLLLFGGIALTAFAGDRRVKRSGQLHGAPRLKRHLWRMCCALFVASIAFYLGPNRLPELMRSPVLRGLGALLPVFVMSLWLWRLRGTRVPAALRLQRSAGATHD